MIRALILCLALLAAAPAAGQDPDPDRLGTIIDRMGAAYETGGDAAAFSYLNGQLRDGRALGHITRDWAIVFAIQADLARLAMKLPLYALDLTEEGLGLIAGDPGYAGEAMALRVSRAWALADLGRFDEAIDAARLALPEFGRQYGPQAAADLAAAVTDWQAGRQTDGFSNSVIDLAYEAINQAEEALNAGLFVRAMTLATQAGLPMGTDLDEVAVRDVNASAASVTGRALMALGQPGAAAEAYLRGLNALTVRAWDMQGPPQWFRRADWDDGFADLAFALAEGLTGAAFDAGNDAAASAALAVATDLAWRPDHRRRVLLFQAAIAYRGGASAQALDLIERSRVLATADGDRGTAVMAGFYLEMLRYRQAGRAARDAGAAPPTPAEFLRAIGAALAQSAAGGIDRSNVLAEAASELVRGGESMAALDMARQALVLRRERMAGTDGDDYGAARARTQMQALTETFLRAAHDTASAGRDAARPTVHCADRSTDFLGCTITIGPD